MWMYAVYCIGAFMGCHGVYYTESSPNLSTYNKTKEECVENAVKRAKSMKAENPDKQIVWKCIDFSEVEIKEVK